MSIETVRDGETQVDEGRSHRFYEKGEQWFVQTREGYELGPYTDSAEAEKGLNDYISFLETADSQSIAQLFKKFSDKQ